jgi:hypothetical protein
MKDDEQPRRDCRVTPQPAKAMWQPPERDGDAARPGPDGSPDCRLPREEKVRKAGGGKK